VNASTGGIDSKVGQFRTVLVNSVCGQVPQRKLRQTFSSGQDKLTVVIPIASGPIICYVQMRVASERFTGFFLGGDTRTSNSLRCISARRPILVVGL
jgi:hypothetical protein